MAPSKKVVELYNRGCALLVKGMYDKAIDEFDEAVQKDPTFSKAYYNRGVGFFKKGHRGSCHRRSDRSHPPRPAPCEELSQPRPGVCRRQQFR